MADAINEYFNDAELRDFYEEIVLCLIIYSHLTEKAARTRLTRSGLCSAEQNNTEMARMLLFHETPYYWAMSLLYSRSKPYWWNDIPGLWPPPEEIEDDPYWPTSALERKNKSYSKPTSPAPAENPSMIIGMWSADIMYNPGMFIKRFLVFRPDGTGWKAVQLDSFLELETFKWFLKSENRLHIKGHACVSVKSYVQDQGTVLTNDSELDTSVAIRSVEERLTPSGKRREVLTFETPLGLDKEFGLVTRFLNRLATPSF